MILEKFDIEISGWRQFRSQVWSSHIRDHANEGEIDLKLQSELGESSKLQYKWFNGTASASRRSAEKYEYISGSLDIFDLEVFPMMETPSIPSRLVKYFKNYVLNEFNDTWHFDSDLNILRKIGHKRLKKEYDDETYSQHIGTQLLAGYIPSIKRNDSLGLASRGDLNGFTAILALVRHAEKSKDLNAHVTHITNLYRMLPTIALTPPFEGFFHQLANIIRDIHQNVPDSVNRVQVNWQVIEKHVAQKTTIPRWDLLKLSEERCIPSRVMSCAHVEDRGLN